MPKAPMTLRDYAFRVALPRESIVGYCINTLIMWAIFKRNEPIPVVGGLSLMAVVAPTAYCAFAFPTFFGIAEGVKRRTTGKSPPPLDKKYRWIWMALWRAFCRGAPVCAASIAAVHALAHLHPSLTVPGLAIVVALPLVATPISTAVFLRTLLSTERL